MRVTPIVLIGGLFAEPLSSIDMLALGVARVAPGDSDDRVSENCSTPSAIPSLLTGTMICFCVSQKRKLNTPLTALKSAGADAVPFTVAKLTVIVTEAWPLFVTVKIAAPPSLTVVDAVTANVAAFGGGGVA